MADPRVDRVEALIRRAHTSHHDAEAGATVAGWERKAAEQIVDTHDERELTAHEQLLTETQAAVADLALTIAMASAKLKEAMAPEASPPAKPTKAEAAAAKAAAKDADGASGN